MADLPTNHSIFFVEGFAILQRFPRHPPLFPRDQDIYQLSLEPRQIFQLLRSFEIGPFECGGRGPEKGGLFFSLQFRKWKNSDSLQENHENIKISLVFCTQMDLSRSSGGVGRSTAALEIADNLPEAIATKFGVAEARRVSLFHLLK